MCKVQDVAKINLAMEATQDLVNQMQNWIEKMRDQL